MLLLRCRSVLLRAGSPFLRTGWKPTGVAAVNPRVGSEHPGIGTFPCRRYRLFPAPKPENTLSSCTISTLPVFFTEAKIVSVSSGISERMSMTSTSQLCSFFNLSATLRQKCVVLPYVITLRSLPGRRIRAFPKGTSKSSGTKPAASTELYCAFGSRKTGKPFERMLVRNSPAASSANEG